MAEPDMLLAEAAREIGLDRERLRQLIASGRLPAYKLGGKFWMVRRADVERFKLQDRHIGWPKGKPRKAAPEPTPAG